MERIEGEGGEWRERGGKGRPSSSFLTARPHAPHTPSTQNAIMLHCMGLA